MFKQWFVALSLASALSAAHAAPVSADDLEECKGMSEIAGTMMDLRQRGASMSRLMDVATNEEDPYWQGVFQALVEQAFNRQRYDTPEARALAVSEFADVAYMGCLQHVKNRAARKK